MFTNICHGWTDFKYENFEGQCSYLTSVPLDLLRAIKYHLDTGFPFCVEFDEEGTSFTLIISFYSMYIIASREGPPTLVNFEDANPNEVFVEIYNDIVNNFLDWAQFLSSGLGDDDEDISRYKEMLLTVLKECSDAMVENDLISSVTAAENYMKCGKL